MTTGWDRQNYQSEDLEQHPAVKALRKDHADAIVEVGSFRGEVTVVVAPDRCVEVLTLLRDDPDLVFDFLSDLTAVHWIDREDAPFDVVYQLYSIENKMRFRIKTRVKDGVEVDTAYGVWRTADWLEREVYDMFGIRFAGHPDQRRILNPDDFEGHPLRKEFPLGGQVRW